MHPWTSFASGRLRIESFQSSPGYVTAQTGGVVHGRMYTWKNSKIRLTGAELFIRRAYLGLGDSRSMGYKKGTSKSYKMPL